MLQLNKKLTWGLALAGCLGVISLYGAHLYAQTRTSGAATSEEAAKEFLSFMINPALMINPEAARYAGGGGALDNLVAQKNLKLLGEDGVSKLFGELYRESIVSRWKAESTVDDQGDTAVVEFTPSQTPHPVICARENGRWRVDLIATYARWNDLDEKESLARVSEITGAIIPGVPINQSAANSLCEGNLKQIALGIAQYTQDYDEMYPPANKWCDVIQPYVKAEKLYTCPLVAQSKYGYAMNWKFSRQSLADVQAPAQTVNMYESNVLRRNANGDGKDLTFRHELDAGLGANYAYADGHVKWVQQGTPQEFRLAPAAPKKKVSKPQY